MTKPSKNGILARQKVTRKGLFYLVTNYMNNLLLLMSTLIAIIPASTAQINNYTQKNIDTPAIEIVKQDDRAQKIDAYFAKRNMPLEGHGQKFVEVADNYGLDPYFLPAIAVRESSGCKRMMNNNCFGWGSAKIVFDDFDQGIEVVGRNMGGQNPNTASYYGTEDLYEKLYWYNGTVLPSYPNEVLGIMEMFRDTEV
ncbi:MAG: hypothetical protein COU30_03005 [Candidatus Magasanikbacteria bacterium CG10_big_fil_rev_8_21_14_0_10_38_6]|uniref:Mannosyl-glycoprotein endo-beta-N-acetylglucosamidase-like domain-containing protein n=1 Tax=Candidatus Magasanikbacteria bacterium CG10_big_fil_rev_8_21_14_0_10_38_6 TaxID=1974647 RepID=A0A2M6P0T8_9BACT|nr:MAG: hypothetical protein COU30_03005 [Candidatus Magasanikbacteria bacterium CG10_big_fil_rev_8_21_14_0_10_38_6]